MKRLLCLIILIISVTVNAQQTVSDSIKANSSSVDKKTDSQIIDEHTPAIGYYSYDGSGWDASKASFADQVTMTYHLTSDELTLLKRNHFMVTERINNATFCNAFYDIYVKDLPVMITTDAILNALHSSYDRNLQSVEHSVLDPNLNTITYKLYSAFPKIYDKYKNNPLLDVYLKDLDLFVCVGNSIYNGDGPSHTNNQASIDEVVNDIYNEKLVEKPLFSYNNRLLDYSQFTPRGHYFFNDNIYTNNSQQPNLETYFREMMWYGFIDFTLTKTKGDVIYKQEDVDRMLIDSYLINELIDIANVRNLLNKNDSIITNMLAESDNLSPNELQLISKKCAITDATELLDSSKRAQLRDSLLAFPESGQKILSNLITKNVCDTSKMEFPIAFKVLGQRFILDSYVFQNVVFGRIPAERLMPDPLDVMYCMGNDNALPLLQKDLNTYSYMKYLEKTRNAIDMYDSAYWKSSFYTSWLQSIRQLNPIKDTTGYPFFMKSAAWQHEKMNTQLGSWTQLRHDNMLYAKQSYSPVLASCDYPHVYVEPYPYFYKGLADFTSKIAKCYKPYFWKPFSETMTLLQEIATKEINHETLNETEITFLKNTFRLVDADDGYNGVVKEIKGWYPKLYLDSTKIEESDFIIADVHTQPSDSAANPIGKVMHVGVGKINMGVFVAPSSTNNNKMTAFVGPVFSYYQKYTNDFKRLNDKNWDTIVKNGHTPLRPDWTNIYMTNKKGELDNSGRHLQGEIWTFKSETASDIVNDNTLEGIYIVPQLFDPIIEINAYLLSECTLNASIISEDGKIIMKKLFRANKGVNLLQLNYNELKTGLYFCNVITSDGKSVTKKFYRQ